MKINQYLIIVVLYFLSIFFLGLNYVYAYDTPSVHARVLPQNMEDILKIESVKILDINETSVHIAVRLNRQAKLRVKYGEDYTDLSDYLLNDNKEYYEFEIKNLKKGSIYFYKVIAFTDKDSISTDIDQFKTKGYQKIIPTTEKFKNTNSTIYNKDKLLTMPSVNNTKLKTVYPLVNTNTDFVNIEDLSIILLFISIISLLLVILKKLIDKNKEKNKKWK